MSDVRVDDVRINRSLLLGLLEPLRLAYIYALKDSYPEELGSDFKPWKWEGSEIEYARGASDAYRRLLDALAADQEPEPIDYEEEGFANRILFDVWVCITERDELTGAEALALKEQIKDDEQFFWDVYIGPLIDRVVDDFREREES